MAQGTVGGFGNIPDKRKVGTAGGVVPNTPVSATTIAATKDIASMRTQLTTYNSTLYPSAVLDGMTENDMLYALRNAYDGAGLF